MIKDVRGRFWAEYPDLLRIYDSDIARQCWKTFVLGQMTDAGVDPVTGEIYHTGQFHPAGWGTPVAMAILEQIMDTGDPLQEARDAERREKEKEEDARDRARRAQMFNLQHTTSK